MNCTINKERKMEEKYLLRAAAFRSKLHNLVDGVQKGTPKFWTMDVTDEEKFAKLSEDDLNQPVRFQFTPKRTSSITTNDHTMARLQTRHSKYPPLKMFAHWILKSKFFSNLIIFLIVINTVILAIRAELFDKVDPTAVTITTVLDLMDWAISNIFLLEIILKWVDDFRQFWKSGWNIFDFLITFLFVPAQFVSMFDQLNKFRILRCLKLISKWKQMRLIVSTIFKAFQAVRFICLLLFLFSFIFAVMGHHLFHMFSVYDELLYNESFESLYNCFVTLFMVFTLDHWYALLESMLQVPELNNTVCIIFMILWVLIGSLIFGNIFVGIMVNNFQSIWYELSEDVKEIKSQQRAAQFREEMIKRRMNPTEINGSHKIEQNDWETNIQENMDLIRDQEQMEQVIWPKHLLLLYFELMEELQHNLEEREKLQDLAAKVLLNQHNI